MTMKNSFLIRWTIEKKNNIHIFGQKPLQKSTQFEHMLMNYIYYKHVQGNDKHKANQVAIIV